MTATRPRRLASAVSRLALPLCGVIALAGGWPAAAGALQEVLTGSSYGFSTPTSISSDGTDVWVANCTGNSVTELSAATGALVQVLQGTAYGFDRPCKVSSDGTDVWVANQGSGTVTELSAATGAPVQVISGAEYSFGTPVAIDSDGTHVWVADEQGPLGGSVTELSAATGALVQVISGSSFDFNSPDAISSDRTSVWVTNQTGNSVTELSAATGALTQVLSAACYDFANPDSVSSDGNDVWVANGSLGGDTVSEVSAATGQLIQVIGPKGFSSPTGLYAIDSDGDNVWVSSGYSDVSELSASTGVLQQTLSGSPYGFADPSAVSSDGTNVWVADLLPSQVTSTSASSPTGSVSVFPAASVSPVLTGPTLPTSTCGAPAPVNVPPSITPASATPASSVTAVTPAAVAKARARRVSAAPGGVRLTLACSAGSGSCAISAVLSTALRLQGRKLVGVAARAATTRRSVVRTVVVGRARIRLAPGRQRTIRIKLNAAGLRLLRSRARLPVRLSVHSGASVLVSRKLMIRAAQGPRKP